MPRPSTPRRLIANPLIAPFYLPSLILAFAQGVLLPIMPLFAADLQVSYGLIGLILAGEGIGALLGDVPAGMLLGRFGQKRAMLMGLGCAGLSTVALVCAGSLPQVLILRLLAGFGSASYGVARHTFVAESVAVANRGRAVALLGGIFRLGRFIGPAIGGSLATIYGLRAPFLLFGGACAVAFVVVARFVQPDQIKPGERKRTVRHPVATVKTYYHLLTAAGTGQFFAQMIRGGRTVVIPLYAADVIGLDAQAIGFIISISAAVDMMLFYPTGVIMDQLGRKFAIVPSFLIQAIGMALVPLTGTFGGLLIAASIVGIGNGLGSGTMLTLGADLAPSAARGEYLGIWRLIGDGGSMSGPLIAGAVADLVALPAAALAMSAAGLAAAGIFALFVPETLKKHRRTAGAS